MVFQMHEVQPIFSSKTNHSATKSYTKASNGRREQKTKVSVRVQEIHKLKCYNSWTPLPGYIPFKLHTKGVPGNMCGLLDTVSVQ